VTPKKVVVLGGGAAAVTAAYELTATRELREAHEVTLYTLGWRLGGKGASGRNDPAHRIEEHGLHIWFGFYDNAFSVMRRCYEELDRSEEKPLAKWTDAFEPRSDCVQYERYRDRWVPHHFTLPRKPLTPGDASPVDGPTRLWEMLRGAFAFIEARWLDLAPHASTRARDRAAHAGARRTLGLLRRRAHRRARRGRHSHVALRVVAWLTNRVRDVVWRRVVRARVDDDELRLFFMWLDLAAAMIDGIAKDKLLDPERGFGAINDEEFRAWLARHGASPLTVEGSPIVRAIYDAAFCYEEGDVNRPNVAAGKAAQDLIRSLFCYKGALMYKMQAGMGDTVFAPFYEVLHRVDRDVGRRRVDFRFFHCVTRLGVGQDGASIEEIELVPQATVLAGEYDPLIDVKGLPCWPSEPNWEQLHEGQQLKKDHVNFEQVIAPPNRRPEPITLKRGRDFDEVVLAIPVGALPAICGELSDANRRFARMLDNSHTVMTQAFQLWLTRDAHELGFPYSAGTLASCYVEPLDTYCDMNQLLDREDWRAGEVGGIAYFCGVLAHAGLSTQTQADERCHDSALEYLDRDVHTIWPESRSGNGFAWQLLVDRNGGEGRERFESQYWRANFSGSERYALTLAGSVKHRLWPGQSGFKHLFLAGDWTRNGIDGGSVEAAVTSGMLAARAVCGSPPAVTGTRGVLESDRGEAHG
jgi:uncharacterized protein with NAD-binding domain and iron-sulfur cluster